MWHWHDLTLEFTFNVIHHPFLIFLPHLFTVLRTSNFWKSWAAAALKLFDKYTVQCVHSCEHSSPLCMCVSPIRIMGCHPLIVTENKLEKTMLQTTINQAPMVKINLMFLKNKLRYEANFWWNFSKCPSGFCQEFYILLLWL